jgi:hypothetical protein
MTEVTEIQRIVSGQTLRLPRFCRYRTGIHNYSFDISTVFIDGRKSGGGLAAAGQPPGAYIMLHNRTDRPQFRRFGGGEFHQVKFESRGSDLWSKKIIQ